MSVRRLTLIFACLVVAGGTARPVPAQPASRHMVAAANPLAVEAGLDILARGGSALDAAIAVQMVLGVVEPQASGIGGGGFLLHWSAADRRLIAYDGRETAPAGARAEMFLRPDGTALSLPEAAIGGASVGVPGLMRLLAMAHAAHGRTPWAALFQSAITHAERGFAVPPRLALLLSQERALQSDPVAREIYFAADGSPRRSGETIRNPPLAATLRSLAAEGAEVFYAGPIATDMVAAVSAAARPGSLSASDLANYRPVRREPVCALYRLWRLCGMPPPSSGPLAILQALTLLERFNLSAEPVNSLRSVHLLAEASRLAFADRNRFVADPDFVEVPTAAMLERDYLMQRGAAIDARRAAAAVEAGRPRPDLNFRADDAASELPATSHITIVDGAGNVVSFTTTIEAPFGSRLFVRGFLLNNQLTDFSFQPRREGRSVANAIAPGKRPRSSMSPMIGFDRDGNFALALGSAGGPRIIGDVLHAIVASLDWGLSPQQAFALPRVLNMNAATELEAATALSVLTEDLAAMGHKVELRRHFGGLSGIARRSDGKLEGGADPRRDGIARGN